MLQTNCHENLEKENTENTYITWIFFKNAEL